MKCLEKKPADRWQSAEELIPQLEAVLTPSGGITPTETRPWGSNAPSFQIWNDDDARGGGSSSWRFSSSWQPPQCSGKRDTQ